MPSGVTATTFEKAFKTRYSTDFVDSLVYEQNRLYAMIKKNQNFTGQKFAYPLLFEDPQSVGTTLTQAQSLNAGAAAVSSQVQFELTRVRDYGSTTIDNETLEASKGSEGAFFDTQFAIVDGLFRRIGTRLGSAMYRSGWGDIGRVSSPGASTTLTLRNKEDVVNFARNQVLTFSQSQAGHTLRTGTLTVLGVDRNAGTLLVNANVNTVTSITDGDFIFVQGDRQNSATPSMLKVAGLDSWCPATAPTSTLHFGVDRSVDSRLGGCRFTGSGANIEETLIEAGFLLSREGGKPDVVMMNTKNYGDLVKSIGTKNVVPIDIKTGNVGFRAMELTLPTGIVKIVPDRDCQIDVAWMLQLDTWFFSSLGPAPKRLNTGPGQEGIVAQPADDGIEVRVGWYGNMGCKAPGWNCRIALA